MKSTGALTSYFVDELHFPYCKGCSHTHVLKAVDEALVKLELSPADIDVTTDIGCVGLADALFKEPHTVHTTHGRSTAFAVGTSVADRVLAGGRLKPVVLIGDGGAMIGLLHIVHAAQINADVTVVLHNNFLFGMTGGQNSALSPLDLVTTTTARGNIVPPLDMCRIVQGAGADFVARKFATDKDLAETLAAAIAHPGFALVEVIELCTAYGTKLNELGGGRLRELIEKQDYEVGQLRLTSRKTEFGAAFKEKFPRRDSPPGDAGIPVTYQHGLEKPVGIVISGSAGERVQSSAKLLCQAAVASGLRTTQKNDNPVTQGTGFSFSEVRLSPDPVLYTGIDSPDAVIVTSEDGLKELRSRRIFDRLRPDSLVLADQDLALPETAGRVIALPLRRVASPKVAAAAAIGVYIRTTRAFPLDAYETSIRKLYGDQTGKCFRAVEELAAMVP